MPVSVVHSNEGLFLLRKHEGVCTVRLVRSLCLAVSIVVSGCAQLAIAQTEPANPIYSRLNTFGGFIAYSGTSSHMVLGYARNLSFWDSASNTGGD